jgi:hypothetical protein
MYSVEEIADEDLPNRASAILEEVKEKPLLKDCCRPGWE